MQRIKYAVNTLILKSVTSVAFTDGKHLKYTTPAKLPNNVYNPEINIQQSAFLSRLSKLNIEKAVRPGAP